MSRADTNYVIHRDEAFERRCKRAYDGHHLPTLADLRRLSPFMCDSPQEDMQAFAERLLPRVKGTSRVANDLRKALKALTVEPGLDEVFRLSRCLARAEGRQVLRSGVAAAFVERCRFYAAALGDEASAVELAQRILTRCEKEHSDAIAVDLLRSALGWLACSTGSQGYGTSWSPLRSDRIEVRADHILRTYRRWFYEQGIAKQSDETKSAGSDDPMAVLVQEAAPEGTLVVVPDIGGNKNNEFRAVNEQFKGIAGKPLPMVLAPDDVRPVLKALATEFPHAAENIALLTSELQPGKPVRHRPTILVGTPGSGKSRFCRRYLELLGVYHVVYSCGGIEDASLAGTARRWSSGEAALPLQMMAARKTANPGIILDEIEKVGTSRNNGNLLDALLSMLEPETSTQWFDRYIEAPVNLSGVLWFGTANALDGWRGPLQDRCRILRFPEPTAVHLPVLAPSLMADIVKDFGMRPEWALPLTGEELEAVAQVWQGGSIRKLRRYLERVLLAREVSREVQ